MKEIDYFCPKCNKVIDVIITAYDKHYRCKECASPVVKASDKESME